MFENMHTYEDEIREAEAETERAIYAETFDVEPRALLQSSSQARSSHEPHRDEASLRG